MKAERKLRQPKKEQVLLLLEFQLRMNGLHCPEADGNKDRIFALHVGFNQLHGLFASQPTALLLHEQNYQ